MKRLLTARHGDWSALDAYLREVALMPSSTDEEIAALGVRAATGDVEAQEELVKTHLRMVVKIAHHYAGFGLPLSDLIAEGNLGLIRAAELYDPKFGTKFSTYATIWVKQRIHRAITSQARAVRIPVWRSQRLRKLARLNDEFLAHLGRIPTEEELAARLGLSEEEVAELQSDRIEVVSLDAPVRAEQGETGLLHLLPDEGAERPGDQLRRQELMDEMMACLHDLDDRELEILTRKFGFKPQSATSFRELGRRWGLSHEWVRRIAELALVKVRRGLEAGSAISRKERERRKAKVLARMSALVSSVTAMPAEVPL